MKIIFVPYNKIARLSRNIVITEKIDGTNGIIAIGEDGEFAVGSRTEWILPGKQDNAGFAGWAYEHKDELMKLGPGYHAGEWWGRGIRRGYGVPDKRFYLFNTGRWTDANVRPWCCGVVPVLYEGMFSMEEIERQLDVLVRHGSLAANGFMRPEGVVIFHTASGQLFKKTIEGDESPKGLQ